MKNIIIAVFFCISFNLNAQVALPTFQGVQARTGCSICDTDLVLYYDFESGSGSVSDLGISGNETNGTFQGDADYYSNGKYGDYSMQSPSGSDQDDYLDITGDISDLDMTSEYSFMAWIKIIGGSNGQGIIALGSCCSGSSSNNNRQGYTLSLASDRSIRFWGGSDSNDNNYNSYYSTALSQDTWHHIGVRVNSSQLQILVNGTAVTTNVGSSYVNVPTSPSESNTNNSHATNNPHIGGEGISSMTGFDVLIDEVRVYKEYLSDNDWSSAKSGAW